jgi:hypothetical protein
MIVHPYTLFSARIHCIQSLVAYIVSNHCSKEQTMHDRVVDARRIAKETHRGHAGATGHRQQRGAFVSACVARLEVDCGVFVGMSEVEDRKNWIEKAQLIDPRCMNSIERCHNIVIVRSHRRSNFCLHS